MKSTTYIAKITTQKSEKYLSEGRKLRSTCLITYSLRVNEEIFRVSLLKSVLPFFTTNLLPQKQIFLIES